MVGQILFIRTPGFDDSITRMLCYLSLRMEPEPLLPVALSLFSSLFVWEEVLDCTSSSWRHPAIDSMSKGFLKNDSFIVLAF